MNKMSDRYSDRIDDEKMGKIRELDITDSRGPFILHPSPHPSSLIPDPAVILPPPNDFGFVNSLLSPFSLGNSCSDKDVRTLPSCNACWLLNGAAGFRPVEFEQLAGAR